MQDRRRVGDWIADRYEIFDIHTGGMGVVYVVYDHQGVTGQRVLAIKTLRDEWLRDPEWKSRFAVEGQLWAGLGSHPNIVHAYSVEEFDGKPHILEQALAVDYAFLRAYRADALGNVELRGSSRNFVPSFAKAARIAIVEVDDVVGVVPFVV